MCCSQSIILQQIFRRPAQMSVPRVNATCLDSSCGQCEWSTLDLFRVCQRRNKLSPWFPASGVDFGSKSTRCLKIKELIERCVTCRVYEALLGGSGRGLSDDSFYICPYWGAFRRFQSQYRDRLSILTDLFVVSFSHFRKCMQYLLKIRQTASFQALFS